MPNKICLDLLNDLKISGEVITDFDGEIGGHNIFKNTCLKFEESTNAEKLDKRIEEQRILDQDFKSKYDYLFLINKEYVILIKVDAYKEYIKAGASKQIEKYFSIHIPRSGWFAVYQKHSLVNI